MTTAVVNNAEAVYLWGFCQSGRARTIIWHDFRAILRLFGAVLEDVARYMSRRLAELGVEHELRELGPRRFSLVAKTGPEFGESSLILAGHMDTVRAVGYPEAYSAEEKDGFVYGRGACDMKGALACYLEVMEVRVK